MARKSDREQPAEKTLQELRVYQIELEMQNEELRRTQGELEASRARYFALYELAPVGYVSLDEAGLIVEANLTAALLLGTNRSALLKRPLGQFVDMQDEDAFHLLRRRVGGGEPLVHSCELRMKVADGESLWVKLDAAQAGDSTSGTVALVVITDISRRVEAEAELKRSVATVREAYSLLMSQTALLAQAESIGRIGSWRVCAETGETSWSDETTHILGFNPESHGGDALLAIRAAVHTDDQDQFDAWVARAARAEEPCRVDFRILRPDGELRWVCAHGALEAGDRAQVPTMAGILHDVTQRKLADQEHFDYLEQIANIDVLTGLHNVRGFDLVAEQVIAQAERNRQGIGVIFCDLDGLKIINDGFGHSQGDQALRDATAILRFTLRNADAIARVGGDEFIVLAAGNARDGVAQLNARLQAGVDFFNQANDRPYQLSISSGTAWCEPGSPCSLSDLKATSDANMYAEKERRRDSKRPAEDGPPS